MAFVATLKEPVLPDEDVHILLPTPSDVLRAVSERYKALGDKLVVLANMAGELKLRVEAEEVKVETRWTGLVNPPLSMSLLFSLMEIRRRLMWRDMQVLVVLRLLFQVCVSMREIGLICCGYRLLRRVCWLVSLPWGDVDVGICDGHALVLYAFISEDDTEGPVLTYYIPAHD
jgi:Hus1-like protein